MYANEPSAMDEDKIRPDISVKASKPPIIPPLSLKRFDFKRRISKMAVVAFNDEIFINPRGVSINLNMCIDYRLKKNYQNCLVK